MGLRPIPDIPSRATDVGGFEGRLDPPPLKQVALHAA